MRYIRLNSLTWWAGFASVLLGSLMLLGLGSPEAQESFGKLAQLLAALQGSTKADPITLIITGLGLIGIRDKLERLRLES